MVLFVFIAPAFLMRSSMESKSVSIADFRSRDRRDFDNRAIERLRELKPSHVLIGNSEVESAIDTALLEESIAPEKVCVLFVRGGVSTVWYLLLKHHVVASDVNPEWVFVFFRDNQLTLPGRESRALWEKIPTLIRDEDAVFDRILEGVLWGWKQRLDELFGRIYPIQGRRSAVEERLRYISTVAWFPLPAGDLLQAGDAGVSLDSSATVFPLDPEKALIQRRINDEVFSMDNLRSDVSGRVLDPHEVEGNEYDFSHWCPRSFLPAMVDTARHAGISLCFVRMKTRPDPDPTMPNPKERFYHAHLSEYLAQQGCPLIDLSSEPEIQLSWFSNESHISPTYRRRYTEIFQKAAANMFETAAYP